MLAAPILSLALVMTSFIYVEGEIARAEASGLLCVVCCRPLVDPLVHGPCGNMACRNCIPQCQKCPHCHGDRLQCELVPVAVRLVLAQLAGLKVHCPTCQAAVLRTALPEHVQNCPVECPRGCGVQVSPAEAAGHERECGAILASCGAFACPALLPRRDLEQHRQQCAFVQVAPAFTQLLERLQLVEEQLAEVVVKGKRLPRREALQPLSSLNLIKTQRGPLTGTS